MADEATLVIELAPPIPFTVANATGIEKGCVLKLTDDMTAIANDTEGAPVAGIAASEKIASDGNTKLGVYRAGIFKMTASGSISAGDPVTPTSSAAPNRVIKAATNEEDILGTAMGDATDGQTFLVELKPFGISLA